MGGGFHRASQGRRNLAKTRGAKPLGGPSWKKPSPKTPFGTLQIQRQFDINAFGAYAARRLARRQRRDACEAALRERTGTRVEAQVDSSSMTKPDTKYIAIQVGRDEQYHDFDWWETYAADDDWCVAEKANYGLYGIQYVGHELDGYGQPGVECDGHELSGCEYDGFGY